MDRNKNPKQSQSHQKTSLKRKRSPATSATSTSDSPSPKSTARQQGRYNLRSNKDSEPKQSCTKKSSRKRNEMDFPVEDQQGPMILPAQLNKMKSSDEERPIPAKRARNDSAVSPLENPLNFPDIDKRENKGSEDMVGRVDRVSTDANFKPENVDEIPQRATFLAEPVAKHAPPTNSFFGPGARLDDGTLRPPPLYKDDLNVPVENSPRAEMATEVVKEWMRNNKEPTPEPKKEDEAEKTTKQKSPNNTDRYLNMFQLLK